MEEVFTHINLEQSMMGNGIRIAKMALVFILIPSEKSMREIGSMDKNMGKEHTTTKMGINTLETGLKIRKMVGEYLNILVELFTMENGLTIKLVIKDKLFILAKINTKEIS
jgi:hypothetical protein